ncbi:hypothetical protein OHB24_35590 [Kribbella sp. NBC_00482]|uniref:hypothetical protein n=1 Tax=Kribbella sp. NBC_00482 TaxID=2975968 RepID=UPI002E19D8AB
MPWERSDEASQAVQELKNPGRGWDGLVVGQATKCWYGNQFSLTWPNFHRYGVSRPPGPLHQCQDLVESKAEHLAQPASFSRR